MMRKINDNNTQKTKVLKNRSKQKPKRDPQSAVSPWLDDYLDLGIMRLKPINQATLERLAFEVLEWSKKDDSIVFRDFLDDKNIPEEAYYRWVRTYPDLKMAHTMAKGRVGSRREKGGLFRKMDAGLVTLGLAKYDDEWKEYLAWKASLKDQTASGNVTINLPNITTSNVEE